MKKIQEEEEHFQTGRFTAVLNRSQQPAYTPERNPDEYLNQDVKMSMGNNRAPRDQKELTTSLRKYMKGLQKKKNKVKNFFQHKLVNYAA